MDLSENRLKNDKSKKCEHLLYTLMLHVVESGISEERKTFVFSFQYNISILVKFITILRSE